MSDETDDQDINLQNDAGQGTDDTSGKSDDDSSADEVDGGDEDTNSDGAGKNIDDITDPDELKEMLKGTKKQNAKLFARIQDGKGLKLDKKTGKWVPKSKPAEKKNELGQSSNDSISSTDLYTLIEAKVPKEDIEEVVDYAKLKKITIEEALKSSVVKTILSERVEERVTSNATNTGPTRRGSSRQTPAEILKKANESGEIPEDDAGVEALVEARLAERTGNK